MKSEQQSSVWLIWLLCVVLIIGPGMISFAEAKQATYPSKPIELVVGFAPGAITDLFARFMADELSKKWKVPINVVNKTGGNQVPAVHYAMQAAPNGYTLLVDGAGTSSAQSLLPDLPYKIEDRTFIVRVSANPHGFMVPANAPWKNLNDLTRDVKKDPGKFNWVSLGGSSTVDITTRQYLAAIGVDVDKTSPVSYPGAAPGMNAVAGGHASLVVTNPRTEIPLVQAGKGRIIAVTSAERLGWLADVPTTKEQGLPQVDYQYWGAFSGPAKLPETVVNAWVTAIQDLLKDPAFIKRMDDRIGMYPFYAGSKDFKTFLTNEIQELKKLYSK
jgi:tripartite-type tricarboxylate transporter receptor subunit TctC